MSVVNSGVCRSIGLELLDLVDGKKITCNRDQEFVEIFLSKAKLRGDVTEDRFCTGGC